MDDSYGIIYAGQGMSSCYEILQRIFTYSKLLTSFIKPIQGTQHQRIKLAENFEHTRKMIVSISQ